MTTQAERAEMRARISAAQRQTALVGDASLFRDRLALAADAPFYVSALLADIEERDGLLREVERMNGEIRVGDCDDLECVFGSCVPPWQIGKEPLSHAPDCLITRIRAVLG